MLFQESSHRKRWLYTEQDLARVRAELHATAFGDQTEHQDKKRGEVSEDGTASAASGAISPPTLEEVQKKHSFMHKMATEFCKELKLPRKVLATALVYYKRYWLNSNPMAQDFGKVLLTCIYIAAKIEESYIEAERLCKHVGLQDANAVLKLEVNVLSGLKFDMVVHSPYRSLAGLIQDIDDMRAAAAGDSPSSASRSLGLHTSPTQDSQLVAMTQDVWQSAKLKAAGNLDILMYSDAPLLFPPGLIALAALRSALSRRGVKMSTYLRRSLQNANTVKSGQGAHEEDGDEDQSAADEMLKQVEAALNRIDQLGVEGAQVPQLLREHLDEVDKKMKMWKTKNPLNDPNSQASRDAAAADARAKAEKREAKLKARKVAAAAQEAALLGTVQ